MIFVGAQSINSHAILAIKKYAWFFSGGATGVTNNLWGGGWFSWAVYQNFQTVSVNVCVLL